MVKSRASVIGNVDVHVAVMPNNIKHKSNVKFEVTASSYFDGPYESTPDVRCQTYETAGKMMSDDFTVLEIPTHEAPNQFGTTFTIGA